MCVGDLLTLETYFGNLNKMATILVDSDPKESLENMEAKGFELIEME